jgi:hypothetical protein
MCPCSNISTAAWSDQGVSSGAVCYCSVQYRCHDRMGMASNQQKSVGAQPVSAGCVCDLCRFCRILVAVAASGQGWDLCMVWFCHRLQQSNSLSQHCPEDVLLCTCLVTVCCCALLALLPRLWVHQAPVFLSELDSKLPAGFMRGLVLCCCCRGTAAPGSTGDGTNA